MRRFQRYAFWTIGWCLIVLGIYHSVYSLKLVASGFENQSDVNWTDYVMGYASLMGYALQTIAIALFCIFLARVCKLENDPEFREDIARLVKRLRNAGDKTEMNTGELQSRDGGEKKQ